MYDCSNLLFSKAEFVGGYPEEVTLPEMDVPEICFVGRSNSGKSTMINFLTNRKKLARVSNTPGRTQHINLFALGGGMMMLADLPGYGYARAPRSMKKGWLDHIDRYLCSRKNLVWAFLLIDSRRGIMPIDIDFMHSLQEYRVPFQILITKSDKIKQSDVDALKGCVCKDASLYNDGIPINVIVTSAKKNRGLSGVCDELCKIVENIAS